MLITLKKFFRRIIVFVNILGLLIIPGVMIQDFDDDVTDCCTEPVDFFSVEVWFPLIFNLVIIFFVVLVTSSSFLRFI